MRCLVSSGIACPPSFRKALAKLPKEIQELAAEATHYGKQILVIQVFALKKSHLICRSIPFESAVTTVPWAGLRDGIMYWFG